MIAGAASELRTDTPDSPDPFALAQSTTFDAAREIDIVGRGGIHDLEDRGVRGNLGCPGGEKENVEHEAPSQHELWTNSRARDEFIERHKVEPISREQFKKKAKLLFGLMAHSGKRSGLLPMWIIQWWKSMAVRMVMG